MKHSLFLDLIHHLFAYYDTISVCCFAIDIMVVARCCAALRCILPISINHVLLYEYYDDDDDIAYTSTAAIAYIIVYTANTLYIINEHTIAVYAMRMLCMDMA